MTDLYLKFADEAEAAAVLFETIEVADQEPTLKPRFANIDVLGTLYTKDEEPVAIDGWHVNVRAVEGEDIALLAPYAIQPTNPRRVWAD
jgi:hypothetical protein